MSLTVRCSIDFDAPGKQVGYISITNSTDTSAWGYLRVPIVSIVGGDGPGAVVFGGNHGDEYEGQIATSTLARKLEAKDVLGRLIIIPCLSGEASRGGTRHWPNGDNLNRLFPGDDGGTPAAQLASFISTELFPRVDAVIDIHSGGRTMVSLPVSHMHWEDDAAMRRKMVQHMLAWNTGYHFIYGSISGGGDHLLPGDAARQGKLVVTTELGGGGITSAETIRIANDGLANVLRSFGVLPGEVLDHTSLGRGEPVVLDSRNPSFYIQADKRGLYENACTPGDAISAGQVVGYLHDMDDLTLDPQPLHAVDDGILIMSRGLPIVEPGMVVSVIGQPIAISEIG